MSGKTAQSSTWKDKEAGAEAQHARQKEQEQLAALRAEIDAKGADEKAVAPVPREDRAYEAGFGGQEDLEDRYATTSGEH
ncbi:hypothetical protein BC834DRAFT_966202 [Gloeopeniophorella convolvens]|nr:hypothetical protein BC834DRAFT_966202 [Gloeopeniophorella convolvens]